MSAFFNFQVVHDIKLKQNHVLWFFLLSALLILICLPRFDRHDWGIISKFVGKGESTFLLSPNDKNSAVPVDVYYYTNMIKVIRHETDIKTIAPFVYRPLLPLIASQLPFSPMTSLNLTNLFFLVVGLLFLYNTLLKLGYCQRNVIIGSLMFIISFPVFYYGAIGYVDPGLIGILCGGVYFIIAERRFLFILTLFVGLLIKETTIILLPVAFFHSINLLPRAEKSGWLRKKTGDILKVMGYYAFVFLLYVAAYLFLRKITSTGEGYTWNPSFSRFLDNFGRVRTSITFILSFGLPGFLSIFVIIRKIRQRNNFFDYVPLASGVFLGMLLFVYSIFSAYSDGRFIWTVYPFAIPLALMVFEEPGSGNGRIVENDSHPA
jgi:hypothetical protein